MDSCYIEFRSETYGQPYWFNIITNKSTFKKPSNLEDCNPEIPPGWERVRSKKYGNFYWYNKNNNTSQWSLPSPPVNIMGLPTDITNEQLIKMAKENPIELPKLCLGNKALLKQCNDLNLWKIMCKERGWLRADRKEWARNQNKEPPSEDSNDANAWKEYFMFWKTRVLDNDTIKALVNNSAYDSDYYGPIAIWDTSQVTDMSYLFAGYEFNGDISKWNTSKVKNMCSMFMGADSFNGEIGNWDTSNVEDMSYMFAVTDSFNKDISNWNTSNVTNMNFMFYEASSFNQNLRTNGLKWNTSNVERMSAMFSGAESFNGDISNWDTSKVKDMTNMFDGAVRMEEHNKPKF